MANLIECDTFDEAELLITVISQLGFILYSLQGYTVDGQGIVPVNAKTGQPDTSKARVQRWAIPRQPQKEEYDVWIFPDPRDTYGDDFSFVQSLTPAQALAVSQQFFSVDFTQDHIDQFMANPSLTTAMDFTDVNYRTVTLPHVGDYTDAEVQQHLKDIGMI